MNRTIKFRGWHKEKKEMIEGSLLFWFKACAQSGKAESVFNACEWMQFTGLKDKNGKEIYCGDIVKGYFDSTKVEDWVWLGLSEEEKMQGWRIFEIPLDIVEFARTHYPDDLEVIGNLYENPELLSNSQNPKKGEK